MPILEFAEKLSDEDAGLVLDIVRDDPEALKFLSENYQAKRFLAVSDTDEWRKLIAQEEAYLSKMKE